MSHPSDCPSSIPSSDAILVPTQHGHNKGSETRKVAQSPGESYNGHAMTINILPDGALLDIFAFCQMGSNRDGISFRPSSEWHRLVHVCQRWRDIIFASPVRLDLTLLCTYGIPVRKNLGCWPPFPIVVDYFFPVVVESFTWGGPGLTPNYEDDVTAALEHPDRIRAIRLAATKSLLGLVVPMMQEPFLALTDLWLSLSDQNVPVLPDTFLGGSAPQLQQIHLASISFPALPTLLLSASDLVNLRLEDIPQAGYISPEAMVTSLSVLNRLDTLWICFGSPTPRLEPRYSPFLTRDVLPSLTTFNFHGSSGYLEHLLARIDTPRLHCFEVTYFNQLDFSVPQLSQFISRTENLELARSTHAQVRVHVNNAHIELDCEEEGRRRSCLTLRISCRWLDWQVSHLAQILGQSPAMVSHVDDLSIDEVDLQLEPCWEDGMNDTDWLELLSPFTAVKTLHGSKQLAGHIALAVDGISGEMIPEVLPALVSLSLEDQTVRSVEQFIAVRRLSGHPVTFVGQDIEVVTAPDNTQNDVLSWTSQDPRQSQLFSPWGVVYRFQTDTNAQGKSTTTLWRAVRANREDRVARLEWSPGGGLGHAVIGKNVIIPMADLVRRDPQIPNSRVFHGPDGFQYRWRPATNSPDVVLQDPNDDVIAFIRPTRPTRHQMGEVYAELHFVRSAGAGVVTHPPLMDMVTVTAMLYRFASAFNL